MCAQWKNDSEFMLKSFSQYCPDRKVRRRPLIREVSPIPDPAAAPACERTNDDPEDLYEDGDYEDLDEAWDEWEEGW